MMMLVSTLLLYFLVQRGTGLSIDPLVYWSMDKYEASTLLPDFGNEDAFSCEMSNANYLQPGIIKNALHVKKKKIKLIKNIWRTDCIRNPSKCKEGLTVAFWLKVQEFTNINDQVIMRSTSSDRDLPGIYIGGTWNDETALLFFVRTSSGKQYQATIPKTHVLDVWAHIAMVWTIDVGIEIYTNGSLLAEDQYTSPPKIVDVPKSYPMRVDFILGDILGPIFLLDDFWIFYEKISVDNILSLHELYVAETTTENLRKTTTTEQTPPPRVSTTAPTQIQPSNEIPNEPTNETTTAATVTNDILIPITTQPTTVLGVGRSHANMIEVKATKLYETGTNTTDSTIEIHSYYFNVTIPSIEPTKPTIITTTIKRPVTSSDWQFYNMTWFYVFIAVVLLALLSFSGFLFIRHCCDSPSKETDNTQTEEQSMSLEPLV